MNEFGKQVNKEFEERIASRGIKFFDINKAIETELIPNEMECFKSSEQQIGSDGIGYLLLTRSVGALLEDLNDQEKAFAINDDGSTSIENRKELQRNGFFGIQLMIKTPKGIRNKYMLTLDQGFMSIIFTGPIIQFEKGDYVYDDASEIEKERFNFSAIPFFVSQGHELLSVVTRNTPQTLNRLGVILAPRGGESN